MRYILPIVLCLLSTPSQGSIFTFNLDPPDQAGSWQILIHANSSGEHFAVGLSATGGSSIIGPDTTFDPSSYSTARTTVGVFGDGYLQQTVFACSEIDFHCGQFSQTQRTIDFIGVGDEVLNVSALETVSGPYAFLGPLTVTVSLPDNLTASIVGVPEISTWAMMLLGFIGIAGIAGRRQWSVA